jgi:hypothetical protein
MRFSRFFLLPLLAGAATPAAAQVGHPPEHSPYRDLLYGNSITPFIANIGGDGGKLGIGPHDGTTYGIRYDRRLSNIIQFGLSFESGNLQRLIVDADDSVATRVKGPVQQQLSIAELALQWNITGKKTWHGLAPYFGGTIGLTWADDTPADTSGYRFGTRAVLAPDLGFRLFVGQRLHLRGEVRQLFWQLKYPGAYLDEPADQPGTGTGKNSNAVIRNGKLDEWTGGTEFKLGIGFSF